MLFILLSFFLLTATLGTRILLHQFTPGFHEYEAVFLYASDIMLLLFLFLSSADPRWRSRTGLIRGSRANVLDSRFRGNDNKRLFLSLAIFLFFAFLSVFFAVSKPLALYHFMRLLLLVAFALAVAQTVRDKKIFGRVLAVIAILAVAQALLGIAQFAKQENLGLSWLGESPISATDSASSKIQVGETKILRAYGLFPHPNILGAFLVMGLLCLIHSYLRADSRLYPVIPMKMGIQKSMGMDSRSRSGMTRWRTSFQEWWARGKKFIYVRLMLVAGMFVVMLGLLVTFSRAAWLSATVAMLFLCVVLLIAKRVSFRSIFRLLFVLVAISSVLYALFQPFVAPRVQVSPSEPSVTYRLRYNEMGINLIKDHPLGVGIGNQVFFSVREKIYQSLGMTEVWQWQPIHNLYLLMASEIGVLGALAFLIFILNIGFLRLFRDSRFEIRISHTMLLGLLVFGLFDHFLWTIWQGGVMLWLVLGLAMASSSDLHTQARIDYL